MVVPGVVMENRHSRWLLAVVLTCYQAKLWSTFFNFHIEGTSLDLPLLRCPVELSCPEACLLNSTSAPDFLFAKAFDDIDGWSSTVENQL